MDCNAMADPASYPEIPLVAMDCNAPLVATDCNAMADPASYSEIPLMTMDCNAPLVATDCNAMADPASYPEILLVAMDCNTMADPDSYPEIPLPPMDCNTMADPDSYPVISEAIVEETKRNMSAEQQSLPMRDDQRSRYSKRTGRRVHPAPPPCPICYEDMDLTDLSFTPCPCGFQLCLFCHKTIFEGDGRCPGCRKQYAPLSSDMTCDIG